MVNAGLSVVRKKDSPCLLNLCGEGRNVWYWKDFSRESVDSAFFKSTYSVEGHQKVVSGAQDLNWRLRCYLGQSHTEFILKSYK